MYKIYFVDGTIFTGGEPQDSKWGLITPQKPIFKVEYFIIGHKITLQGYEGYNHLVERYAVLNKPFQGISKVALLAKKGEKVMRIIFDYKKKRVSSDTVKFGNEDFQSRASSGWRLGVTDKTPAYNIT